LTCARLFCFGFTFLLADFDEADQTCTPRCKHCRLRKALAYGSDLKTSWVGTGRDRLFMLCSHSCQQSTFAGKSGSARTPGTCCTCCRTATPELVNLSSVEFCHVPAASNGSSAKISPASNEGQRSGQRLGQSGGKW